MVDVCNFACCPASMQPRSTDRGFEDIGEAAAAGIELHWSRGLLDRGTTGTGDDHTQAKLLQWGRSHFPAEHKASRACPTSRLRRFNGATVVRPRNSVLAKGAGITGLLRSSRGLLT